MIETIYTIGFIVTTIIAVFVMLFTADDFIDFIGMTLRDSIDNFIGSGWPVYEFESTSEALEWMAKKD